MFAKSARTTLWYPLTDFFFETVEEIVAGTIEKADIEKAFSQVVFHLVDRDVTRFYGSNTFTNQ